MKTLNLDCKRAFAGVGTVTVVLIVVVVAGEEREWDAKRAQCYCWVEWDGLLMPVCCPYFDVELSIDR